MFLTGLTILSYVNPVITNQLSATSLSCISMNNHECKVRLEIINFSIKTSKCSGSCNNINNPYAKMCVPDVVKKLKC